jgi:hypothetical protein
MAAVRVAGAGATCAPGTMRRTLGTIYRIKIIYIITL